MSANIVIREIVVEDAAAYNAYRRLMTDEPGNNIPHSFGEYTRTVEDDYRILLTAVANPNQKIFVAALDTKIIGTCRCRGDSLLAAAHHVVGLGLDVDQDYRRQGIGAALLAQMIDWARQHPEIRRVELTVFALNRRAINLYLKHGFVVEGLAQEAYFKDGQYIDAYYMALLFRTKQGQNVSRKD